LTETEFGYSLSRTADSDVNQGFEFLKEKVLNCVGKCVQ